LRKNVMKTLIVTPLQQEMDHLVAACQRRGLRTNPSALGRLPIVELPELGITVARGGTGKAQFAVHTQHLLDVVPEWDLVVCAGAAGGLVDDLSIGDVVVATRTIEHDYNNNFSEQVLPSFAGAPQAIEELRRASASLNAFRVHFGIIASGDEDVVTPARREALSSAFGALAVAWEGAGGARACAFSGVPYVEVRGVTDAADHSARADFEQNLEQAMNHVAALVVAHTSLRTKLEQTTKRNP
jgi:adenosylhomocysteine nucleosidase